MSEQRLLGERAMRGTIRRRLLVNALVDPDEAARHLPAGVRPHVIDGATLVGCCLLDIDAIRPASLPAGVGTGLRAAAHRVSVEWEDEVGATTVGVYVPVRHTDSRAARILGGRWFPGVHHRASIELTDDGGCLRWSVEPGDRASEYGVSVTASVTSTSSTTLCEPIGGTCLSATVGLSPDYAACWRPLGWNPTIEWLCRSRSAISPLGSLPASPLPGERPPT